MRSLVIDTDTGSDDAIALVMAARSPGISVRAVTTVAGNVPLDLATRNALVTLDLVGAAGVPLHEGLAKPILRDLELALEVHGGDGMSDAPLPPPSRSPDPGHAVDVLRRIGADEPGRHVLVTLGPLSNIAAALLVDPDLLTRFEHTFVMGGAFDGVGNRHAVGEFNVWSDPEAAALVVAAPGAKTFVGWDVARRSSVMPPGEHERLRACGPLGEFACAVSEAPDRYARGRLGLAGYALPDPIAMAVAIDPALATRRSEHHVIVGRDGESRGGTFVDHRPASPAPNVGIAWEVDEAGFRRMLLAACSEPRA